MIKIEISRKIIFTGNERYGETVTVYHTFFKRVFCFGNYKNVFDSLSSMIGTEKVDICFCSTLHLVCQEFDPCGSITSKIDIFSTKWRLIGIIGRHLAK